LCQCKRDRNSARRFPLPVFATGNSCISSVCRIDLRYASTL